MELHSMEGVLADAVSGLEHDLSIWMGPRIAQKPLIDVKPILTSLRHRRLVGEHHPLDRGIDGRLSDARRKAAAAH